MFYSKILICAAEIQKLKPEFKPVLSSLTYLIHVHLFIYHLHPQFSSPGHSHQAGHLWRGISHSQRAMADGALGCDFCDFWVETMCFLGFWEDRSQRTTLIQLPLRYWDDWIKNEKCCIKRTMTFSEKWFQHSHHIIVESCRANATSTTDVLVDATRLDMSWRCELSIMSTVCFQEVCNSHY